MKLGRNAGATLPPQAGKDMADALQKGIKSLAEKHGKTIDELQSGSGSEISKDSGGSFQTEPAAKKAWENAKANYKSPSQRAITQETFDEVVQENIDDFEMEIGEAISDACEQFHKQGVNLSNIIKTISHFTLKNKDVSGHPVTIALDTLRNAVVAKDGSPEGLAPVIKAITDLLKTFDDDEEAIPIANSNDGVGINVTVLRTFPNVTELVVPCLTALHRLCLNNHHSTDQFNQFGLGPDVVLECVRRSLKQEGPNNTEKSNVTIDSTVLVAALALVKVTALRHNGCKDQFFGRGVASVLLSAVETFPTITSVVRETALAFRSLIRSDGTIDCKAPTYLKELMDNGWLERLTTLMIKHLQREDQNVDGAAACAFALEAVAVNEKACTEAADLGAISALVSVLGKSVGSTNAVYARRAAALLAALARSDKNKELISDGIPIFAQCMIRHAKEAPVQRAFLAMLTAICLRQPEIAEKIVEAKGHHLAVSAMRLHPTASSLQRAACMLLRNLGSRSPAVRTEIAEVGAEKFLRFARQNHAVCEDVAYAALRDLGFKIEGMRTYKIERPMHGMFTDD